jgi:hypothetical protein
MLPTTKQPADPSQPPIPHESINDLPVHRATQRQIFFPTSESRHFTRADAAAVFHKGLLPADARIPHPELIDIERDRLMGLGYEERVARAKEREEAALKQKRQKELREERKRQEKMTTVMPEKGRWEWRFENIKVDDVGKDGRAPSGVGWRYGVPHQDRKRGIVKIPTKVD